MRPFFCFILTLIFFTVSSAEANDAAFHPPQTEAERALDHILMLDHKDRYFPSFVFKAPERDKSKDRNYSNLFTKELEEAWEKAYLSIPPEDTKGGRYVATSFVACGQESSDQYFYATVKSDEREVYIAVVSPPDINVSVSSVSYPFRMIREGGKWKLDGVRCAADSFHYPQ